MKIQSQEEPLGFGELMPQIFKKYKSRWYAEPPFSKSSCPSFCACFSKSYTYSKRKHGSDSSPWSNCANTRYMDGSQHHAVAGMGKNNAVVACVDRAQEAVKRTAVPVMKIAKISDISDTISEEEIQSCCYAIPYHCYRKWCCRRHS
ncbi:hypothetical protein ACH5RR_008597 [Cinchona calisaya]|uniref:Uncharacterized protein n=1 Tax=Cinchona calisaya TaxID=153742 RepID=A0ABD3AFP9_9GENT